MARCKYLESWLARKMRFRIVSWNEILRLAQAFASRLRRRENGSSFNPTGPTNTIRQLAEPHENAFFT